MQIIPRVSVYGNRVVVPASEGYEGTAADPISLIEWAHEAYGRVILEDLDAIFGRIPHLDLLRRIEKLDVWVDGGIRFSENVMDVLVAGGSKAVVGSKTLQSFDELEKALKLTKNIILQIDYCNQIMGRIGVQFRTVSELFRRAKKAGVEIFVFMDNHCSPSPIREAEILLPDNALMEFYVGILSRGQAEESHNLEPKGGIVEALELIPDE